MSGRYTFSQVLTHTPLLPVDKAEGIDTKFSFITSSSKSSIGYSFRCSEGTKGEKGRARQVRGTSSKDATQMAVDVFLLNRTGNVDAQIIINILSCTS